MGMPSVTIKCRTEQMITCLHCRRGFAVEVLTPQTRTIVCRCPSCHQDSNLTATGTMFGLHEISVSPCAT
jgi:Zn finger protein HypA/HybF involved in hydrogenase expression